MTEQELKAEAFDRIVGKFKSLEKDTGFYMRNWVELAELIEAEIERIKKSHQKA